MSNQIEIYKESGLWVIESQLGYFVLLENGWYNINDHGEVSETAETIH